MSLMKSLARVAAGVMLAKGVGAMMKNAQGGATAGRRPSGGILDDLLKTNTARSGSTQAGAGGGLGDMLGQVLGGRAGSGSSYGGAHSPAGRASGGLGGILDQLTAGRGGSTSAGAGGGLGSILAGGAAAGGIGGILGELLGGGQAKAGTTAAPGTASGGLAQKGAQASNDSSFGELFNDALSNNGEPATQPTAEQNALAGLMLKAMIQAAKADGEIDEQERAHLMKEFGELDEDERQFIRDQMAAPVDAKGLAAQVPEGYGAQVYLMSLMAIDFDNRKEAEYLHELATALNLDKATVNGIHDQVGATNLYA
ncbi:DUF533 domain-containing protein [Paracoccus laeviglucosivorans]|uniref:Uncharacterized membrane protein YebE, DUF533 family n=1 Tax=Paracoccus laeviglucosivorans TaxID=1197861 RepID=A0A521EWA3_9RHOB|nr:DUF533 domain-containing protein [Paracoccus laeviglucosivorans]SMO88215.1 Uncharacterized membrane protein YebE, DUF533 family [Paracoccus laeviglucosivorans]